MFKRKLNQSICFIVFFGLTFIANQSYAIKKLSACSVQLDDNRIIDLSSLDKASSPRLAYQTFT
jgi:hypothetical protein